MSYKTKRFDMTRIGDRDALKWIADQVAHSESTVICLRFSVTALEFYPEPQLDGALRAKLNFVVRDQAGWDGIDMKRTELLKAVQRGYREQCDLEIYTIGVTKESQ